MMSHHRHAEDVVVEEKLGAVEIENVETLDQSTAGQGVDEVVEEEQAKVEKRAT